MIYGIDNNKCIVLANGQAQIKHTKNTDINDILIHNSNNKINALVLSQMGFLEYSHFPIPIGVIYRNPRHLIKKTVNPEIFDLNKMMTKDAYRV